MPHQGLGVTDQVPLKLAGGKGGEGRGSRNQTATKPNPFYGIAKSWSDLSLHPVTEDVHGG